MIAKQACKFDVKECVDDALDVFQAFSEDTNIR